VPSIPTRSRRRRIVAGVALFVVCLLLAGLFGLGWFLTAADPLQRADAIFVLGGTRIERPLEAADLFQEGWAPIIVLSRQTREPATRVLEARGASFPTDEVLARDALVATGIPADHILVSDTVNDNTAQEAETLRALAAARHWHRVIIVSSKFHLRRAGFAMRRELAGTNVEVVMHGSRYDPSQPARWWMARRDIRQIMLEAPKMAAYLLGLGA
jgi:uncharacterized SAM-binding protein YcdF (DUF218 family)